jgi:hypothetical protein
MKESTERLAELVKKARPKFNEDELLEIFSDLSTMSKSSFVELLSPQVHNQNSSSTSDPNYEAFMEARDKLSHIRATDYIIMLMQALSRRSLLGSYQPTSSQANSVAKFYEGITKRLNADTIVRVARELAEGKL